MNDPKLPLPGLSPVAGKSVVAQFDGGLLSSDGGVLALRAVEQRLRVAARFAACIEDPRAPDQITHTLADIIRFRLLMIAAGYEDGNDAAGLRRDPLFKMALDRAPSDRELCSQPTISRLENLPDVRSLLRIGRAMVDLYCSSFRQVPKRIVLDIDDTFDAVHGGQQLRLFNAYHDEYGFQPIVVSMARAASSRPCCGPPSARRARKSALSCAGSFARSRPTGRGRRSCCAPTATIAARRSSPGVAPTGSTSSSASRQPRPYAGISSAWKPAQWRATPLPRTRARCAVTRSSTTAPRAGAGSSASSLASRLGPRGQTPASSSRACRPETLVCCMRTSIAGAAMRRTTLSRGRRTWPPIARPAPRPAPTSSASFCMPARIGCCGACAR